MIHLKNIFRLDIVSSRTLLSGIAPCRRCLSLRHENKDFESVVVTKELGDIDQLKKSTNIYGNIHNEIFQIAKAARVKKKGVSYDLSSEKSVEKKRGKFSRKNEDDESDLVRDEYGRYMSKTELENDNVTKKSVTKSVTKSKQKDKMQEEKVKKQKQIKTKTDKQVRITGKDRQIKIAKTDKQTSLKKSADRNFSEKSDKMEDAYYKEFMKMIFAQKQPPLVYTPANGKYSVEVQSFIKELEQRMRKSARDNSTFKGLGIKTKLLDILKARNITKPTPVQKESIPELLQGKNAIIQSSTGSGKTLTFLLPLLQNISSHARGISIVIVVPTRELATQIYKELIACGLTKDDVSRQVSGVDEVYDKKLDHALKDCKIMIGTPKKLLQVVDENSNYFRQVRAVVMDEVDKLIKTRTGTLTQSYREIQNIPKRNLNKVKPTEKLIAMLQYFRKSIQFVATSATISNNLFLDLQDMGFGNDAKVIKLNSEKHARVPENIKHLYCAVPQASTDKFPKLRTLNRLFDISKEKSILVFIRGEESVEKYVEEFKECGYTAYALYKQLQIPNPNEYQEFLEKFEKGDVQIVVSNEETVRGIDFPFLNHVYLTFVPDSPEKYLHLAGRVGRLGRPGQAVTLIPQESLQEEKKHWKRRLFVLGVKGKKLEIKKF